MTRSIAGVTIPDSAIATEATELIREAESDLLFDHSQRVFVFGCLQGDRKGLNYDPELLYVGAMFHDLGLVDGYRSQTERFEVDGANAARDFLAAHGISHDSIRVIWDAIALHTTRGIPAHKEPEVALLAAGVGLDVVGIDYDKFPQTTIDQVVRALPRTDFKESIIQAFADGIAFKPETTYGTINADVLAEKLPGYKRQNFCDMIRATAFES